MDALIFTEEQKFSKRLTYPIIILVALTTVVFPGWGMVQQLIFGRPYGTHPMTDSGLLISGILIILLMVLLCWLLLKSKLITEINRESVKFRLFAGTVKISMKQQLIFLISKTVYIYF